MKLLLDANISRTLVSRLDNLFPDSTHVALESMERATDQEIWEFALANDYVIVSKDEDFHQRALVEGPPPKVVWIRLGNCSTADVERVIRQGHDIIANFEQDKDAAFLTLD